MATSKLTDNDKGYKAFMQNMKSFQKGKALIGVFGDKKNKEGTSIAEYATYNEFGATITSIKARYWLRMTINKINLYRVKKTVLGHKYVSIEPVGPIKIPARSFMRSTYDEQIQTTKDMVIKYIRKNFLKRFGKGTLGKKGLSFGAAYMAAQIKLKITNADQWAKPISTITMALKSKRGGLKNKPLMNTGALRNSITYKIK